MHPPVAPHPQAWLTVRLRLCIVASSPITAPAMLLSMIRAGKSATTALSGEVLVLISASSVATASMFVLVTLSSQLRGEDSTWPGEIDKKMRVGFMRQLSHRRRSPPSRQKSNCSDHCDLLLLYIF